MENQMTEDKLAKVEAVDPLDLLLPEERRALRLYKAQSDIPLAPHVQAQLFQLYLNGSTCEEIQALNPNFSLGMIVKARVEGLWDARRQAHISQLLEGVRERVMQVQAESVVFTADLLAAANKMFGDKLKKYIQTGDPRELGDLQVDTLKKYRDAVELLLKLTGQDQKSKVTVEGTIEKHTTVEVKGKLTAAQAAATLKAALGEE